MKRKNKYRTSAQIKGAKDKNLLFLHFARILVALVFIFSGFAKAVDPLGTVYKIQDYLIAFEGIFTHFLFAAYPLAISLIAVELIIGFNLLFQVKLKYSLWAVLGFTLIMSGLTLYIAIYNPVTDCGCFGDALKIDNWTTFYKNIVLLVLIILLLVFNKRFRKIYLPVAEWGLLFVFMALSLGFMSYNLANLPLIDFRPYKVGVNIMESMNIPDDAPVDEYEYIFTYEKEGAIQEFSIHNLPDSTWKFVTQNSILIKEGYKPAIEDFVILTQDYDDLTDQILSFEGKTVFIVMYDLSKSSKKALQKIKVFLEKQDVATRVMALTASTSEEIAAFKKLHQFDCPFYIMDPITLKTMIRANPGVIILENGTIQAKWNGNKSVR